MRVFRARNLALVEAALIGLFFIQALRFLIGLVYSRVAGASVVAVTDFTTFDPAGLRLVDPAVVTTEITVLGYLILLPLLSLLVGRWRSFLLVGAVAVAAGRLIMIAGLNFSPVFGPALTVGAGLFYLSMLIRHRARLLPYFFLLGLAFDQLLRAAGNTLDPSWSADSIMVRFAIGPDGLVVRYLPIQIALSILVVVLAIITFIGQRREAKATQGVTPDQGLLPVWGGIGLGALLFIELSLLTMPNAVAGRAGVDYTTFVPLLVVATVLPLIPYVRARARAFITLFDGSVRGWTWMLIIALLVAVGTRFPGVAGGGALVGAQFCLSLLWWWMARPRAEKERSFTGLWLLLGVAVFMLLLTGDFFTYEYPYVRDFTGNFSFLNSFIPPLLRGFRGMGLGVLLFSVFLSILPMTQVQRRIPWAETRSPILESLLTTVFIAVLAVGAALAARPPLVQAMRGVETMRVGTYNIHAGFSEFFHYDLEAIALTIQQSGSNIVMLQEVEAGRLTSFGVDQPLWLARRLGMDRRYFATNEGLQGLAVLSQVPIIYHRGSLLTSTHLQTGVQHIQVTTDGGVSAVAFYNTWLGLLTESPGNNGLQAQEQDQQRQLNEIFTLVTRDYPDLSRVRLVLGGTFNNVPKTPLLLQMEAGGFVDPFAGRPVELAMTLWRSNLRARLDYIWTRNVTPLGVSVMESAASDHRLAVAEIQIVSRVS